MILSCPRPRFLKVQVVAISRRGSPTYVVADNAYGRAGPTRRREDVAVTSEPRPCHYATRRRRRKRERSLARRTGLRLTQRSAANISVRGRVTRRAFGASDTQNGKHVPDCPRTGLRKKPLDASQHQPPVNIHCTSNAQKPNKTNTSQPDDVDMADKPT